MAQLSINGGQPLLERYNLGKAWPIFDDTEREALIQVLESGKWWSGAYEDHSDSQVGKFEAEFARYQGAKYGRAVTNGTAALELALRAGGIEQGAEVIVPASSFIATAMAVSTVGAVPVFVDIDPETYTLSPEAMKEAITGRTQAVIPVHLGGYPADMDEICPVAAQHGLVVIEDCAHVHGTVWDGHKFPVADMGAFSFQQGKTLTAGEGGIVLTDNEELAARAYSLSTHGRLEGRPFYEHHLVSSNLRMTDFQGALLRAQFARFDAQIKHRDENSRYLAASLQQMPGLRPGDRDERLTQWGFYHWNFKFLPEAWEGISRDRFLEAARAEGLPIGAGIHVDPMYRQPVYAEGRVPFRRCECPNCEYASQHEALSLNHIHFSGPQQDMDLILEVFEKIWDNRDELRK